MIGIINVVLHILQIKGLTLNINISCMQSLIVSPIV